MPYANRYRTRKPRTLRRRTVRRVGRGTRRRRYARRRTANLALSKFGPAFSNACYKKLKFYDHYNESSGAATFFTRVFRGNSVYDPEYTGVGGAASGYANYARMFLKYRVLATKVRVVANNVESYNVMGCIFMCPLGQASIIAGTNSSLKNIITEALPNGFKKWCLLPGTSQSGNRMRKMQLYGTTRKVLGPGDDNDRCSDIAGNPTEQWAICTGFWDLTNSNTGIDTSWDIYITYYVKFYEASDYYYDA